MFITCSCLWNYQHSTQKQTVWIKKTGCSRFFLNFPFTLFFKNSFLISHTNPCFPPPLLADLMLSFTPLPMYSSESLALPMGSQQSMSHHLEQDQDPPLPLNLDWATFPSVGNGIQTASSYSRDKYWFHGKWPHKLLKPHNCHPHPEDLIWYYVSSPAAESGSYH